MTPPVGLIGLGLLGAAIGERLSGAGFSVVGWDVDSSRRDGFAGERRILADSCPNVAARCRRIMLCLPTSAIVRAVVDELAPNLRHGDLIVDATTGDPDETAAVGRDLAERGVGYVDATVGGSSRQAREGDAIVTAGGSFEHVEAARDLLEAFARRVYHVGPCGSGARMKLVVNLVLGLNRAVLAEGIAFARSQGVDARSALEVLRDGPSWSRVMDTKGEKMLSGDFTADARLTQHLKDVRLILESGARSGAALPLSEVHSRLLEQLVADGWGDLDNAAIALAFSKRNESH